MKLKNILKKLGVVVLAVGVTFGASAAFSSGAQAASFDKKSAKEFCKVNRIQCTMIVKAVVGKYLPDYIIEALLTAWLGPPSYYFPPSYEQTRSDQDRCYESSRLGIVDPSCSR